MKLRTSFSVEVDSDDIERIIRKPSAVRSLES